MIDRDEIDTQRVNRLIQVTARQWGLGVEAANRCIERSEPVGRSRNTALARSERSQRAKGGGRRALIAQSFSRREFRRWNDHRASDTRLGQGR